MRHHYTAVYIRLMKYAMFTGILGGIASFIGPPRHGLIKAGMGMVVGAMLLGNKQPSALNELRCITDEFSDEIFKE